MANKWSNSEIALLNESYGKLLPVELFKLFPNRSHSAIYHKVNSLGLTANLSNSHRKWFFNLDYFSKPNIANSYWAGFIAADGNVFRKKKTTISQAEKEVLEKFNRCVDYSGPIPFKFSKLSKRPQYYVEYYSKQWVEDLYRNFNIIDNKSLKLQPPIGLSIKNSLAFIIGYIDGDGTIFQRKTEDSLYLSIIGTHQLLEWIRKIAGDIGNISIRYPKTRISKNPVYIWSLSSSNARKFLFKLESIQALNHLRLNRKWNKVVLFRKRYCGH